MSELPGLFARDEYRRRWNALGRAMAGDGIEALLLTAPADIFYVTGFLTRFWESPARPWFVVLPAGGAPMAVIPEIGAALMGRTWVEDIRTWPAPDPQDDGVSLLAETLCEVVSARGRIGLPMGAETQLRMPLADYARLGAALGARSFVDATDAVQRVREVKSEPEIARIAGICVIAGRAFDRVPEFAAPGVPLDAVFRDFQAALLAAGADWVSYLAGGAGRGGYGDVISPAGSAPLAAGDVLMLDAGAVRQGYFCDFDRNFAVGAPAAGVERAQAGLFAATEAALARLRPGMRACDAHACLADPLRAAGLRPLSGRLGHGLGVTLTEWPSFTPRDTTPLRAGMVLTLEPGVQIAPGRILVHEEVVVLRDEGCALLSPRAPERLPVI